ncbi:hypothetical protein SLS57_011299 [Botryosphaeria dothidea]
MYTSNEDDFRFWEPETDRRLICAIFSRAGLGIELNDENCAKISEGMGGGWPPPHRIRQHVYNVRKRVLQAARRQATATNAGASQAGPAKTKGAADIDEHDATPFMKRSPLGKHPRDDAEPSDDKEAKADDDDRTVLMNGASKSNRARVDTKLSKDETDAKPKKAKMESYSFSEDMESFRNEVDWYDYP